MSRSDKKYRSDAQLMADLKYNRHMQNTHKMRGDACQAELDKRKIAKTEDNE